MQWRTRHATRSWRRRTSNLDLLCLVPEADLRRFVRTERNEPFGMAAAGAARTARWSNSMLGIITVTGGGASPILPPNDCKPPFGDTSGCGQRPGFAPKK